MASGKWFSPPKQPQPEPPPSVVAEEPSQPEEPKLAERQGADVIKTPTTPKTFGLYSWTLMEQKAEQILFGDFKNVDDIRRDMFQHATVFTLRKLKREIDEIKKELGL